MCGKDPLCRAHVIILLYDIQPLKVRAIIYKSFEGVPMETARKILLSITPWVGLCPWDIHASILHTNLTSLEYPSNCIKLTCTR